MSNLTRPDVARQVHRGYLGAGAEPAREPADEFTRPDRPRFVLASVLAQLHPEQSTDAFVAHHPEAKYFNA